MFNLPKKKKKALSVKHSKTGGPIFLIHKSTHIRTQVRICENVCMFPCYQLHRNWSICANGNICKLWVNGLRYVGAPRTAHDYRTVSSKLQWRELENQGTSLAFQGLRVCASTAGGMDSIPGQGTKIPHAAWPQTPHKEKGNSKKTWFWLFLEFNHQSYSLNVFSG